MTFHTYYNIFNIVLFYLLVFIHIIYVIIQLTYPFIISKNFLFDFVFIFITLIAQIFWFFTKGECIISTIIKTFTNTTESTFFQKFPFANELFILQNIIIILSLIIVSLRVDFINTYLTIFVMIIIRIIYLLLNNACEWNSEKILTPIIGNYNYAILKKIYKKYFEKNMSIINNSMLSVSVIYLMYLFYKNKTRLYSVYKSWK